MPFEDELAATREALLWMDGALGDAHVSTKDGSKIPQRVTGALRCFHQAIEHAMAIERLCSEPPHFGSAFALLRSVFETLIRGLWLLHAANDNQAQKFIEKDQLKFTLDQLISKVEKNHLAFDGGLLSRIKANAWDALCSYAHTGSEQIARRMRGDEITANYSDSDLSELLPAARFFALMAGFELTVIFDLQDEQKRLLEFLEAIASRPKPGAP